MLGVINSATADSLQSVDSQVEYALSTQYLINTEYIIDVEDHTSYGNLRYKFNIYDDRQPDFSFYINDTAAFVQALSDVSQDANMINLDVFEGVQSFNQVSGLTAVETALNVSSIVWAENDTSAAYCRLWYLVGGKEAVPIIVDHTIAEIVALL